jgi:hypothetical protein
MTTTSKLPVQPVRGTMPTPQRSGPVPLDPKLFRHVAGGSPRGGWLESN